MPTLSFTNGPDSYTVTAAGTYDLSFLGGDDTLTVNGGSFTTARMGTGNDRVTLRVGDGSIFGEAGNDRFDIYASGVQADGGEGADHFVIRGGNGLRLVAGLGNDRFDFVAGVTGIVAHGNDGDDLFYGGSYTIGGSIYGDAGNDYFTGFGNRNGNLVVLYGGLGNDTYRADPLGTTIIELAGQGTDTVLVARGQTFVLPDNVENLKVNNAVGSTDYPASLVGNNLNNAIIGNALNQENIFGYGGNDKLTATDAKDVLYGGDGNDTLIAYGSSWLYGEVGNDTYYVDGNTQTNVIEAPGEGTDTIRILFAGGYQDWFLPGNVENVIQAVVSDNFQLHGNALANAITGSSGPDILFGGDGNDKISGGADDDYIVGQNGSDRLTGGAGNDTFSYYALSDSPVGNVGVWADFITDFVGSSAGGGDRLDVRVIDAVNGSAVDDAFHYSGQAGTGEPGDLWITTEADGYRHVWGDVNGDYMPDFEIVVAGSISIDDIGL